MSLYTVRVNKLNKRTSPVTDFSDKSNIAGFVTRDFLFESDGEITNSLGKWYRDRDGFYYWAEGLKTFTETAAPAIRDLRIADVARLSWAHSFLEIPTIWEQINTKGKNTTIAIIDTGVNANIPDLVDCILPNSIFINEDGVIDNSTNLSDRLKDNVGHGTEMAGIIGCQGIKVFGIAPETKLFVIKVADEFTGFSPGPIIKAFEFLGTQTEVKIDIISASFSLLNNPQLESAVTSCISRDIAIFAAIGDNHIDGLKQPDTFPACYPSCTAIGAFDSSGQLCSFSNWNDHLSLLAPGDENVLTIDNNNLPVNGSATSIATAITAASFALLLSFAKTKPRFTKPIDYLRFLFDTAVDMGPIIGRDDKHGFGRLNIRNAISTFKNEHP